jgi:hypothetical protein
MIYSAEAGSNGCSGSGALNPIYCGRAVAEACKLIRMEYRRPIEYAAELAISHVKENVKKKKKRHKGLIHAMIGEMWLTDMLVNWLGNEQGWEVDCPITTGVKYENGKLKKLGWGSRVSVQSDIGDAELDCLQMYGDLWVIGEAKSGANSYSSRGVNNKIERLGRVVENRPSFVIGVPKNHQVIMDETDKYIESMGGRVLVFGATVEEMHDKAEELYANWNEPFVDRKNIQTHRKHPNERTGRLIA